MFEGADRCGKSTQTRLLVDALAGRGADATLQRFPDRQTAIGSMIDRYLKCEAELDDRAVHLLFANAGVMQDVGPTWERPLEDFDWVFGVNLWGPLHCVRSFVPRMLERGEPAHVVITASMSGLTVVPGNAAYQMSKHGTVALAETLYQELVDTPVGVSVLCPGYVETGITRSDRNRPEALRNAEAPPPRAMAGGWTGDATEAPI